MKKKVNIDTLDFTKTEAYGKVMFIFSEITRKSNVVKTEAIKILAEMPNKPSKKEIKKAIEEQINKVFDDLEPQVYIFIGESFREMLDYNEGYAIEYYTEIEKEGVKKEFIVELDKELDKRIEKVNKIVGETLKEVKSSLIDGAVQQINNVLLSNVKE